MKNILLTIFISIVGLIGLSKPEISSKPKEIDPKTNKSDKVSSESQSLFREIKLDQVLDYQVFELALNGYNNLKDNLKKKDILTIVDFSLPSSEKRMFVIDLKNKKLLYHTIVSHGVKSGELYATKFSNRNGSHQSSLGFYITENTYNGGNGYSLVINGMEKNINDQAKNRAVVIHGADYCSEKVIKQTGRLGRSYGCPALPRELNGPIINTIKEGSLLFIYAENNAYLAQSRILKNKERTMIADNNENTETTTALMR